MNGQLWQECPRCKAEPVCAECQECEKHCTCQSRQIANTASVTTIHNRSLAFVTQEPQLPGTFFDARSYLPIDLPGGVLQPVGAELGLYGTREEIERWCSLLWANYCSRFGEGQAAWLMLVSVGGNGYGQAHREMIADYIGEATLVEAAKLYVPLVVAQQVNVLDSLGDKYRQIADRHGLTIRELAVATDLSVADIRESLKHRVADEQRTRHHFPLYREPDGNVWSNGKHGFWNVTQALTQPKTHPVEESFPWLESVAAGVRGMSRKVLIYPDGHKVLRGTRSFYGTDPITGQNEPVIEVDVTTITPQQMEYARLELADQARIATISKLTRQRPQWKDHIPFPVHSCATTVYSSHNERGLDISISRVDVKGERGEHTTVWVGDLSYGTGPDDAGEEHMIWTDHNAAIKWYDTGKQYYSS